MDDKKIEYLLDGRESFPKDWQVENGLLESENEISLGEVKDYN